MTPRLGIAVLISGTGRSLQNLQAQIEAGNLDAEIRLVISSSERAAGAAWASNRGLATRVIRRNDFSDAAAFGEANFTAIRSAGADLVVMAGYLKLLPIPADYEQRVINIHPALIPAFCGAGMYGDRVHQAVLDYGAKVSGCTVHFVDNEYDSGPIICQRVVDVDPDDTSSDLADRVFAAELELLPQVVQWIAEGRIHVTGRQVRIQ